MKINRLILRYLAISLIVCFCSSNALSQKKLTTSIRYDTLTACLCQPFDVDISLATTNFAEYITFDGIDIRFTFDEKKVKFDSAVYINNNVTNFLEILEEGGNTIRIRDRAGFSLKINSLKLTSLRFSPIGAGEATFVWDTLQCIYSYVGDDVITNVYSDKTVLIGDRKPIVYQLEQLVAGCSYERKGQYVINITDGNAPYSYLWQDSGGRKQTSENAFGLAAGKVYITVRDKFNCRFYDSAFVHVNAAPEIDFTYDEEKKYYISKPIVSFENTSTEGFNWFWDFGDTTYSYEASPTKTFKRIGNFTVTLKGTNDNGCDTTVFKTVEIKDYTLRIPNVFTPNGDGMNDTFAIYLTDGDEEALLNDMFYDAEIKIFDVNGKQVFYSKNYNNEWDAGNVVDATYVYHLRVRGQYSEQVFKGSVFVMRGNTNKK